MTTTTTSNSSDRLFMTLEEFMAHAKDIKFIKGADGQIRTPDYRECPVCAVANKLLGEKKYRLNQLPAAHAIGLPSSVASMVAVCADFEQKGWGEYADTRVKLEGLCQ